jgi:hypothetical protein
MNNSGEDPFAPIRDLLEDWTHKLRTMTNAQRRKDGWVPPEEIAAYRAVLERIYTKTQEWVPGTEAELLRAINHVISDLLYAQKTDDPQP